MSALDQNLKNAVSNLISLNYGSALVPSEKFSDEKSDTKKDELDLNTIILPKLSEVSTAAMNFHSSPLELPSSKDIIPLSIESKNALKHPFIGCLPVAPN